MRQIPYSKGKKLLFNHYFCLRDEKEKQFFECGGGGGSSVYTINKQGRERRCCLSSRQK